MVDERRVHPGPTGDRPHARPAVPVLGEDGTGRPDDLGPGVDLARASDRAPRSCAGARRSIGQRGIPSPAGRCGITHQ